MKHLFFIILCFFLLSTSYMNAQTVTISGKVTYDGAGLQNVKMILSGSSSDTVYTDVNGDYSFSVATGGTYTVTPIKSGYSFTPISKVFALIASNQVQNFTATLNNVTISGAITTSDGTPLEGVKVKITGTSTDSTTTDANGNYSIAVGYGGTYTVTPTKEGYTFTPAFMLISEVTEDQTVNFTGKLNNVSISGIIKLEDNTPLENVKVELTGTNTATTYTDATGSYSFTVAYGGSYTVTPTKEGYTFAPTFALFNNLKENTTADFIATPNNLKISGTIKDSLGNPMSGVYVVITGNIIDTVTTGDDGKYSFTVAPGGSYIVKPYKNLYVFTPEQATFNAITTNQIQDFVGVFNGVVIKGNVIISDSSRSFLTYALSEGDGLDSVSIKVFSSTFIFLDSTISDNNGNFRLQITKQDKYYLTFTKDGFFFPYALYPYNQILSNIDDSTEILVKAKHNSLKLAGFVKLNSVDGNPVSNVVINMVDGDYQNAITDSNGYFEFKVHTYDRYELAGAKPGLTLIPSDTAINIQTSDTVITWLATDTKYKVTVKIHFKDDTTAPVESVLVVVNGMAIDTAMTNDKGEAVFELFQGGPYIVTPIAAGYSFDPITNSINILNKDTVLIFSANLAQPILLKPIHNREDVHIHPRFKWTYPGDRNGIKFRLRIATDYQLSSGVYDTTGISDTVLLLPSSLEMGENYYWTVRAIKGSTMGDWAAPYSFKTLYFDDVLTIQPADSTPINDRIPLLLIHGWSPNGRAAKPSPEFFDNFISFFNSDITLNRSYKLYYVNYWANFTDLETIVAKLREKIEELDKSDKNFQDKELYILAHSMGGLVARAFMQHQRFSTGQYAGQLCGERVKLLITLGTPHHGSYLANGNARDEKIADSRREMLRAFDEFMFGEVEYNDVNRFELHWDNYNNFLDYTGNSDEQNLWLSNLNNAEPYASKIIAYAGKITGSLCPIPFTSYASAYLGGAFILSQDFSCESDGIVPYNSAIFDGKTLKKTRVFDGYDHNEIVYGKSASDTAFFKTIRSDLLEDVPLNVLQPDGGEVLKHDSDYDIMWIAPLSVNKVDIYYSLDSGATYNLVVLNQDAADGVFTWHLPDTNVTNALVKVKDAEGGPDASVSFDVFTIYHNRVRFSKPIADTIFEIGDYNYIKWDYDGVGEYIDIDYLDLNDSSLYKVTKSFYIDSLQYLWKLPDSIPIGQGKIKIRILNMDSLYGDNEIYDFYSDSFKVYPTRNIKVLAPGIENYVDIDSIQGEKLFIDSTYRIKLTYIGRIEKMRILLGEDKDNFSYVIADTILSNITTDEDTLYYDWKIPVVQGDKWYIKIYDLDRDTVFAVNEHSFRIRRVAPILLAPSENSSDIFVYPDFSWDSVEGSKKYVLFIKDTTGTEVFRDTTDKLQYSLPHNPLYELLVGRKYNWYVKGIDSLETYLAKGGFRTVKDSPDDNLTLKEPARGDTISISEIHFEWSRPVKTEQFDFYIIYDNEIVFKQENISDLDTTLDVQLNNNFTDKVYWVVKAKNIFGEVSDTSWFYTLPPKEIDIEGNHLTVNRWERSSPKKISKAENIASNFYYKGISPITLNKMGSSNSIKIEDGYIFVNSDLTDIIGGEGNINYNLSGEYKSIWKGSYSVSNSIVSSSGGGSLQIDSDNDLGGLPSEGLRFSSIDLNNYSLNFKYDNSRVKLNFPGIVNDGENDLYFNTKDSITIDYNGNIRGNINDNSINIGGFKFSLQSLSFKGNIKSRAWIQANKTYLRLGTGNGIFNMDVPMYYTDPFALTLDRKNVGFCEINGTELNFDIDKLFPSLRLGSFRLGYPYIQSVWLESEGEWALQGESIFILPIRMVSNPGPNANFLSKWRYKAGYPVLFTKLVIHRSSPYLNHFSVKLRGANIMITPVLWFTGFDAEVSLTGNRDNQLERVYLKGNANFGLGAGMTSMLLTGKVGAEFDYLRNSYTKLRFYGTVYILAKIKYAGVWLEFESIHNEYEQDYVVVKYSYITDDLLFRAGGFIDYIVIRGELSGGFRIRKYKVYVNGGLYASGISKDFYIKGRLRFGVPKGIITVLGVDLPPSDWVLSNLFVQAGKFNIDRRIRYGASGNVRINCFKYPSCHCSGTWWKPWTWDCDCEWKTSSVTFSVFVPFDGGGLKASTNFYHVIDFKKSVYLRRLRKGLLKPKDYAVQLFNEENIDSLYIDYFPEKKTDTMMVVLKYYTEKRPELVLESPTGKRYYSEWIIEKSDNIVSDSGYYFVIPSEAGRWKACVLGVDKKDDYRLGFLGENLKPSFEFKNVLLDGTKLKIDYSAYYEDSTAFIDFYYTKNDSSDIFKLNFETIKENDGDSTVEFDISGLENGEYSIFALVSYGSNAPERYYYKEKITITDENKKYFNPTNLRAKRSDNYVLLQWDGQGIYDYFNIYYSNQSGAYTDSITEVYQNYYFFKPVNNTTRYYMIVKSVDKKGNEIGRTNEFTFVFDSLVVDTIAPPVPNKPTLELHIDTTLEDGKDSTYILVKWDKVDGASGYTVRYDNLNVDSLIGSIDIGDEDSVRIINLDRGTSYLFKIAAYDSVGNYSDFSEGTEILVVDDKDSDGDGILDDIEIKYFGDINVINSLTEDYDEDGLSNGYEIDTSGTNPAKWDTDDDWIWDDVDEHPLSDADNDNDMMADDWESYYNVYNPDEDDDNDSLSNKLEYKYGCDPTDVDTDGGGVSDYREIMNGTDPRNKYDDYQDKNKDLAELKEINAQYVKNDSLVQLQWKVEEKDKVKFYLIFKRDYESSPFLLIDSLNSDGQIGLKDYNYIDSNVVEYEANRKISYIIKAKDEFGNIDSIGYAEVEIQGYTGLDEKELMKISAVKLYQNYPNPFNNETKIRYELPKSTKDYKVRIVIYNTLGQRIKELYNGIERCGRHEIVWNGQDDYGRKVKSGVYILYLKVDKRVFKNKLILIK